VYGDCNLPEGSAVDSNNVVWVPVLVPFWGYPTTFDEVYTSIGHEQMDKVEPAAEEGSDPEIRADARCDASAENSDSYSDASTDVGDDDDIVDDCEEDVGVAAVEGSHAAQSEGTSSRPCLFGKVSRQQRVEQVKRIVEEYCSLEFDVVDASCQEALVLRMLTILKSLSDRTTFVGDNGCCEATRFSLLGLNQDDANVMRNIICHAEKLWTARLFHAAFDVLKQVVPKLRGLRTPAQRMSPEEVEAMKLRRLEKRQRQRGERREQRAADRVQRSSQRYNRRPRQSSSSAAT